jgi:hypothetical protein
VLFTKERGTRSPRSLLKGVSMPLIDMPGGPIHILDIIIFSILSVVYIIIAFWAFIFGP